MKTALVLALPIVLCGACGRTELWPALEPAGIGNDGGTDVPAASIDATANGKGDGGRRDSASAGRDPCSAAGNPCGAGQHCVPALFRQAPGVPGGPDLVLALGDLNRDGLPDLVTVSPSRNSVTIWLNDVTTGFHTNGTYIVPPQPIAATIGDFNGDGVADIAVATFSGGRVTTLLGAPDGTFYLYAVAEAGASPRALVATDLNDDGRLDLAVADQDPNRTDDITLLTGAGGGLLIPSGRYGTFPSASSVAVGDFNGDHRPDVAAASAAQSSASVFYHGGFSLPFSQHVASGTRSIAVGDFDGDGIDDLALSGTGSVAILFGTSNTALRTGPVLSTGAAVDGTASTVVAGDFDGDGQVDLAFADGKQLYLFLGSGTGQFQPARAILTAGDATQPTQLVAGDLDGDGVTDLLVGSVGGAIVQLLSNANGVLSLAPSVPTTGLSNSSVAGDFDGDGNIDIAIAQYHGQVGVLQLLGDGRGAFPRSHTYEFGGSPGLALAADLDGDGRSDLIVLNIRDTNVSVRLGRSDGTLGDLHQYPAGRTTGVSLAVLDANEDGRLDVVVPGLAPSDGLALLIGNGDGTLQPLIDVPGAGGNGIAAADLDGDGHSDLAIADMSGVRVLFGDGRAHFSTGQALSVKDPLNVIVGDANGDGRPDIIAFNMIPNGFQTVLVGSDRTPVALNPTPIVDPFAVFAATGDINGDGRLDVAFDGFSSNLMGLALGRGDGTYRVTRQFPGPGNCSSIAVTDLNNDGRLDVVAVTTTTDQAQQLGIWLGTGPFECR